jgi:hypothetical protein
VWPSPGSPGWGNGASTVTVAEGVTLTIPAGASIPMVYDGTLAVRGRLVAHGDPTAGPVHFTSQQAAPAAGDWKGLVATGAEASVDLRDVEVRYAGAMHDNNYTPRSERPAAVDVRNARSVVVLDSLIADAGGAGILVDEVSEAPHITGNTIERCGLSPQYGAFASWAWGIVVNAKNLNPALLGDNRGNGNRHDGTLLAGTVATSGRLAASPANWPYGIGGGYLTGPSYWETWWTRAGLAVDTGVTLTLDPGVVLKFATGQLAVRGTLISRGTNERNIILTSWHDDTVAGDTDHGGLDGGTDSPPQPNDWALAIQYGSQSEIEATQMRYRAPLVVSQLPPEANDSAYGYNGSQVTTYLGQHCLLRDEKNNVIIDADGNVVVDQICVQNFRGCLSGVVGFAAAAEGVPLDLKDGALSTAQGSADVLAALDTWLSPAAHVVGSLLKFAGIWGVVTAFFNAFYSCTGAHS